jgi:hypothetical protein
LVVSQWRKRADGDRTDVSATIGDAVVSFGGTALEDAPERGDPWLALGLIPAMAAGADLDLREMPPVSPRLLAATETIQDIWTAWNPELRRVEVLATPGEPLEPIGDGNATFFSGGVDALHAALDGGGPGEQLVYIHGFDFSVSPDARSRVIPRLERLAGLLDSTLVVLQTDWIEWRRSLRLSGALTHGGLLAACAHLLAPRRMTIASSNTWGHITPWGSHPLADPFWSTEATEVRHWGSHRSRAEKVQRLAERPDLVAELHVCHARPEHHCGVCAKCVRSRVMLRLVGLDLPALDSGAEPDPIPRYLANLSGGSERIYLAECRGLAEAVGATALVARIDRAARKVSRRRTLREVRDLLFPAHAARLAARMDLYPWGRGPNPGHP